MREPGYYADYPSKMVSKYYCWCKDQGYPELDVTRYDDGEWALIQYHQTPLIPSLTRWSFVLQGLRNMEITPVIIKKYADQLNLEKQHVWAEQDRADREAIRQAKEEDRRSEDFATRMLAGVKQNPALMERIYKNGFKELNPMRMLNQIPRYRLGKGYRENPRR